MGYYINQINGKMLPAKGKAEFLIENGAEQIKTPIEFIENLVCVVENFWFDAAAFAYSEEEMFEFSNPSDNRKKTWLVVPNAAELSSYK